MMVAEDNSENSDIRTRPIWKTDKTSVTTNDLPIKEILEQTLHTH